MEASDGRKWRGEEMNVESGSETQGDKWTTKRPANRWGELETDGRGGSSDSVIDSKCEQMVSGKHTVVHPFRSSGGERDRWRLPKALTVC
jgi:hypothetical protein